MLLPPEIVIASPGHNIRRIPLMAKANPRKPYTLSFSPRNSHARSDTHRGVVVASSEIVDAGLRDSAKTWHNCVIQKPRIPVITILLLSGPRNKANASRQDRTNSTINAMAKRRKTKVKGGMVYIAFLMTGKAEPHMILIPAIANIAAPALLTFLFILSIPVSLPANNSSGDTHTPAGSW